MTLEQARILYISDLYPPHPGDISHGVRRVAQLVHPHVEMLEILTFADDLNPGTVTTEMEEGINIYRLGVGKSPQSIMETISDFITLIQRRNNYHVFHSFKLHFAGYMGTYLGHYLGVKSVLTLRRDDLEEGIFSPTKFPLVRWTLDRSQSITCTSRDLMKKVYAIRQNQNRVVHIPESVDATRYVKKKTLASNLPAGTILGYFGEMRIKYGFKILLHAFQVVAQKIPEAHLVLVGKLGKDEEKIYHQFSSSPGLKGRIHLYPQVEPKEIPYYLSTMDTVIFPAIRGDIPHRLYRAMACECQVVCSDIEAFKEIIESGKNGYLAPTGNPRALATRILKLLENTKPPVGPAARELMTTDHTPDREREKHLEVYRNLLPQEEIGSTTTASKGPLPSKTPASPSAGRLDVARKTTSPETATGEVPPPTEEGTTSPDSSPEPGDKSDSLPDNTP